MILFGCPLWDVVPDMGGAMSAITIPVYFNSHIWRRKWLQIVVTIVMLEIISLPHYSSDEIEKVLEYYLVFCLREMIG